ncbi:hypothetical protein C0Q70_06134 [Pomacea canaliculata]|uniref:Uncharacterized protein n=1 Tax=Pomacea canaliculata TaxID=400727 RepID=A0A2T7PN59_POMCA|nr:hypothetical protein C0Q70_06134 [Pomacea canaliculata]
MSVRVLHSKTCTWVSDVGSEAQTNEVSEAWCRDREDRMDVCWLVVTVRQHPPIRLEPSYSRLRSRDSLMNNEITFSQRRALCRM